MNEMQLKLLLCNVLRSGHIKDNDSYRLLTYKSLGKRISAALTS